MLAVDHTSKFPVPFITSKMATTNPISVVIKIPFMIAPSAIPDFTDRPYQHMAAIPKRVAPK